MYDELVKRLRTQAEADRYYVGEVMLDEIAADAIEELSKPRWVSVTERLPELHEEVLVCNEDYGKTELGFSEVAVWDGSDWICTWDMESRLSYITHWMPLPEPPKEEAE